MKTIFFIAVCVCLLHKTYAQEPSDALRYSFITQSGTARNQAIGGASGSLGGEFSTLFTNPAGLGFYKTNEFVFSSAYTLQKFKATYKGELATLSKNIGNIPATGALFSVPNYTNAAIKNFTIAIGMNRAADFNSNIYYKGKNTGSSYSEKYLEELIHNNVTDPNSAAKDFPFGTSLAFNTFLIDTTIANGSFGYKTAANSSTGLLQENTIHSSGGITDFAIGGAVNLREKLFFGATVTVPVLHYKRDSHFRETDASANTANNFNYFEVNETLDTKGVGINGKFGMIYKPVEYVRLGLAVHTPTLFDLTDKYSTEVITDLEGYGGPGIKKQSSEEFTNSQPGTLEYNLITPWRVIGSASYVFREVENVKKQKAFITADIEYINYKAANFKVVNKDDADTKNYFHDLNAVIDQQYKSAFNFRLGGELKFNTIMARLGGAYYGNPYANEKASRIKLAGGLGYRDKGIFVDVTYVYAINKDVHYPYRLQDKANEAAFLKNTGGNIVATVGFKFY
ncbi:MAG: aromatic hydrocarbon degradation protein [Ginsengibacter sp.]